MPEKYKINTSMFLANFDEMDQSSKDIAFEVTTMAEYEFDQIIGPLIPSIHGAEDLKYVMKLAYIRGAIRGAQIGIAALAVKLNDNKKT